MACLFRYSYFLLYSTLFNLHMETMDFGLLYVFSWWLELLFFGDHSLVRMLVVRSGGAYFEQRQHGNSTCDPSTDSKCGRVRVYVHMHAACDVHLHLSR